MMRIKVRISSNDQGSFDDPFPDLRIKTRRNIQDLNKRKKKTIEYAKRRPWMSKMLKLKIVPDVYEQVYFDA